MLPTLHKPVCNSINERKGLVPENLGREKLDSIIKEEMKHIRLLSNKLASLKA